jgi:suppressor for copper-sensitivity B
MFISIVACLVGIAQDFDPEKALATSKPEVSLSIRADREGVEPGGSFKVLFAFKVPETTYFYSDQKNPNGIGVPTTVDVKAPAGYTVGKPEFPKPETKQTSEGPVLAYRKDVVVAVPISAPANVAAGGTAEVTAKSRFQYCDKDQCYLPKNRSATISLKIIDAAAAASQKVETPTASVGAEAAVPPPPKEWPKDLWIQLGFAFLAGLILNVMPCVLPVIAIKVLSFVQHAGESRSKLAVSNLTYALGVLSVFWVLSGFAIYAGMNWGQQFQSPWFTLLMAWAVFALSLSLLGVFEIPLPGFIGAVGANHREGLAGVFLSGAASTVLATPCTGPFLGPLLAWSLAQQPVVSFMTWTTVGLGMASPYIVFAVVPGAVKLLPRPGQWMVTFKQVSGFVMMATAVFLLSTFKDKEPIVRGLFLFVATGFYFWLTGSRINVLTSRAKAWGTRGLAIAGALFFLSVPELLFPKKVIPWQPFTEQRLLELVKDGKPVLIDFTADWCFNCRVNEKVAIEKPAVLEAVKRLGVEPLYADYTNYSNEITKWIRKFGSDGIPLTVVIAPGDLERRVAIDGLFTEKRLLEVLEATAAPKAAAPEVAVQR